MIDPEATLIVLTEELKPEFLAMAAEYLSAGEDRYKSAPDDFTAYIRGLSDGAYGIGLPPGRVPYSTFWLKSSANRT